MCVSSTVSIDFGSIAAPVDSSEPLPIRSSVQEQGQPYRIALEPNSREVCEMRNLSARKFIAVALLMCPIMAYAQGGGGGGGGGSGGGSAGGAGSAGGSTGGGAASGPTATSPSAVGTPNAGSTGAGS